MLAACVLAPLSLAIGGTSTLYDLPVSNHGARVRLLLYKRGLESAVKIASPMDIGGLKSDKYLSLNPQGKMPLLVDDDGLAVWESDAICRHLIDKHESAPGPSLRPSDLRARTVSEMMCRLHDSYIGPIQGCLYRAADTAPWGGFANRADAIRELVKQLAHLEDLAHPTGPYLTGSEFSLADATLFPTLVFIVDMLPKFDETIVAAASAPPSAPRDAAAGALGPKLLAYWSHMSTQDAEAMRVAEEIRGGLASWDSKGRWEPILGAGTRDTAPATIFDKILAREIPSEVVYEDDVCLAFRDINPAAPTHVLLIPKERQGLVKLGAATAEHAATLGHMMVAAAAVAKQEGLEDFRLVSNCGESACQTVFHLHLHLIGGRDMTWPPG
jgi:glutathione S-transferase/diadenosine tetraphosphate (Ap4A) HIT family hydrolase